MLMLKLLDFIMFMVHEQLDEKFGNVIGIWRAKVKKNPLPIVGDGNQKRDFTHVLIL